MGIPLPPPERETPRHHLKPAARPPELPSYIDASPSLPSSSPRTCTALALPVPNPNRKLNDGCVTLPDDGIAWRYFEPFQQHIESMNAVIVNDYPTGTCHHTANRDLHYPIFTLNLLSC